jgi:hypothetical protein
MKHVRVPIENHILSMATLDIGIDRALLVDIIRHQLDMVLVVIDTERTLEERLQAVSFDRDSCPPYGCPSSLAGSLQCATSIYFVFMALDGLAMCRCAIGSHILHVCILGQDIVIGLEF